jgi:PAS domain-containing protein
MGLGGTGSRIAQNVFLRAKRQGADHGRLRVLAFDTDENDQGRLGGLAREREKIRFSSAYTIDDLLDRHPQIERDWFVVPRNTLPMELRKMTLLDGAGQVRMLTRLALWDSILTGSMERVLGAAVADLVRYDNLSAPLSQINVLMVGSLAGATGSGSFLQLACLLRDIATRRNVETTVRGLFLLPDVYVSTGALPAKQLSNVMANGYASFKEFHAMTLKAADRGGNFEFDFEYAPGKFLQAGDLPFASLTVIDYEDTGGGNLGRNLGAYSAMMEKAAYTLLFTPVGGKADSVTVNDVRETAAAAGRGTHNRIAAIGISALTYPQDEIRDYLANQVAREIMAGDWLRLDRQFRDRLRRFRDQRAAGNMSAVEPQQGQSYLQDIRQLAVDDQLPFFREIHDKLNPVERDEYGNETAAPLHLTYLEALNRQVVASFWDTDELRGISTRGNSDKSQFASDTALVDEIRRREARLEDDYRTVERALTNRPADILTTLMASSDDMGETDWRAHHLQYFLVRSGPHPVQARAFLFALRQAIDSARATLGADEKRLQFFKLANGFRRDDEDRKNPTSRGTANVLQLAADVSQRGMFSRMLKGSSKDFVEQYVTYYNASIRKLVDYGQARLLERVYERLIQEVDEQIRVLNGLFQEVESVLAELERLVSESEVRHDRANVEGSTLYVCADSVCKRALWEETLDAMAGQRLEEGVNKSIMSAVVSMARRNRNARRPEGLDKLRDAFREAVVDGFARDRVENDFTSVHDKSVVEALRHEAETKGLQTGDVLRQKIDIVRRQSQAMVTLTDPNAGQAIQFWSLNTALRSQMAPYGDVDSILSPSGQGSQSIEDDDLPANEILSVSLRVNLELQHLAKLSPPYRKNDSAAPDRAGKYFVEYQRMVEQLIDAAAEGRPPDTITPHIHRDWHKPGLLPEISEEITRRFVAQINKGFAVALALKALSLDVRHGNRVAEIRTVGRIPTGSVSVDITDSHGMFEIVRAFALQPEAVRGCLRLWEHELKQLAATAAPDEGLLEIARPEVVETILMVAETRRDEALRDAKVSDLITGHCHMLWEAMEAARPNLGADIVLKETEKLIAATRDGAFALLRARTSAEAFRIMESRHAFGVEKWRQGIVIR